MDEREGRPGQEERGDAPSPAATARLRESVAGRTGELRQETTARLGVADGLRRAGAERAALEALTDYQRVLRAYAADLERMVGEAAVEREAERVLADASERVAEEEAHAGAPEREADAPVPADTSAAAPDEPAPPERGHAVRRALSGALLATVIAAGVLVPNVRSAPQAVLAAEHEARQELESARERLHALQSSPAAAEAVTKEARELHERILALSAAALEREVVRDQVRQLLDLEEAALQQVVRDAPEAPELLDEIRAIRTSLALDEPGIERPDAPLPSATLPGPAEPAPDVRETGAPEPVQPADPPQAPGASASAPEDL